MANALQFSATVQAASPVFSKRMHCQSLRHRPSPPLNYNLAATSLVLSKRSRRALKVSCEAASVDLLETNKIDNEAEKKITCVMKFGGSSVASAERMREVAELILSFPNESPVIVLSAMGKTTNKLLLVCLPACLYFDFLLFYLFFEGKFFLIWST
jgi:aspartate kinase